MRKIHAATIILFLIAAFFYILTPILGVIFFVLGVLVELVAWVTFLNNDKVDKNIE